MLVGFLLGFYFLSFIAGYGVVRVMSKERQKVFCDAIYIDKTLPLWALMTIANGEAIACQDLGHFPRKATP
jgi:hypothetical protein